MYINVSKVSIFISLAIYRDGISVFILKADSMRSPIMLFPHDIMIVVIQPELDDEDLFSQPVKGHTSCILLQLGQVQEES